MRPWSHVPHPAPCQRNVGENVWPLRPRLRDSVRDLALAQPRGERPVLGHQRGVHVVAAVVGLDDGAAPRGVSCGGGTASQRWATSERERASAENIKFAALCYIYTQSE